MPRTTSPWYLAALALVAGCAAPQPPTADPAGPFNELGRADAPVIIVEFSDLQCPHCARHAAQVLPELRRHYVDTGRLRYVARDLPLPMHAQAFPAAVVARCAGEQGRFWEFREALFMARMRLGEETYAKLAGEFGLDAARLEACRRDGAQAAAVRADAAAAARQGIRSTPTFVIGRLVEGEIRGELVVGSKDFETFAGKIDALLAAPR